MSRSKRPKGKARPRRYHHGKVAGEINDRMLGKIEPHYEAAEADRLELERRAREHRESIADWRELWASLEHVAPFVPSFTHAITE